MEEQEWRAALALAVRSGLGTRPDWRDAVFAASESWGCTPEDAPAAGAATWFDVRRGVVYEQADSLIAGARWRDPTQVDDWATTLDAGEDVIVYCVHGHEVSRAVTLRLRATGMRARFLVGGIAAWQDAGRPTQARSTSR